MAQKPEIADHCAQLVRRLDHDRYLCAQFAPRHHRWALMALLAFNVEVGRIASSVSEPLLGRIRLQWWRDAIESIYSGGVTPDHPVLAALAEAVSRFDLSRVHFDTQLDSRFADLEQRRFPDLESLIAYAGSTSASLNFLGLEVIGVRGIDDSARQIGIAWSLTGLMRAVPFHARHRTVYVPENLMDEKDVQNLFELRPGAGLREAVKCIAEKSNELIAHARQGLSLPPRAARPILLPAVLADAYLTRLRRAGYDPFRVNLTRSAPASMVRMVLKGLWGRF